jgi:endonuclease YncB( thermonuclease family)
VSDPAVANAVVGTPEASAPVAVPSAIDGKPATATHFTLQGGKDGSATPIAPITIPEDVNWGKPFIATKAKERGGEKAVVTFVNDGDGATLLRGDGSSVNCRIDTIDAPETAKPKLGKPGQAFGEESKRTLQDLIDKKQVTLTVTQEAATGTASKDNNYGRALCKIEVEGVGVDLQMLQKGAAWLYRKYGQVPDSQLEQAEQRARLKKEGLWANPAAENPATFRRRAGILGQ